MIDFNLDVNVDHNENIPFSDLPSSKFKINKAIERSLKKTINWLGSNSSRLLAKENDVAIKSIRERLIVNSKNSKNGRVQLWVGLNDLHAHSIGKMRQTKAGISVRSHRFKGAFIRSTKSSDLNIGWRRESSKHSSDDDEVRNYITGKLGKNHESWPRYPLVKVGVHLYADSLPHLINQERLIDQKFNEILKQELNYEFNVKT